jgi:hypothetical protein
VEENEMNHIIKKKLQHYLSSVVLLSIAMVVCNLFPASGQVSQPHRYEREHKSGDEQYTVISLNEEGIALLRQKDKFNGNKRIWELVLLDTALQEKSITEFQLEDRYPLIGFEVSPGKLYLLFRTGDTVKNDFLLLELSTKTGSEKQRYEIKPELEFRITHFSKIGSSLVMGGYVSNDPTILLYNMTEKNIKAVPGFFIKDNELVDLRVNQNQTFNVVLIDRSQREARKLIFKTFDESGKLLLDDVVSIEDDRSIQTSMTSTLQREDMMVLGTWGERQGKQSNGFFALPVDPFNEQKIRYFHFGELNHFVDYLNPKRAARIKENTKEDVEAGKIPSFVSHVIPYKIIENPDGYLLLAEVYNPVNISQPYTGSPYGASPYYATPYYYYNPFYPGYFPGMRYRPYSPNSYGPNVKNQDEVKTYSSVLMAFDPQGNLLWDQSVKLDNIESNALEQVSDFYYNGSTLIVLYKKESELKIKTVAISTDDASEQVEKIKLKEPADEVRNEKEMEGGIKHWTANSFYVWGYQTIRNLEHKDDRVRDVFYLNKVVVH